MRPFLVSCVILILICGAVPAATAQPSLRIGFLGPLTGAGADAGHLALDGFRAAVRDVGDQLGLAVVSTELDTRLDPSFSVDAAQRLVEFQKVSAMVGDLTLANTVAASEIANKFRTPLLTYGSSRPTLDAVLTGKYVFRVAANSAEMARKLANYAVRERELALKKFVIFVAETEDGRRQAEAFREGVVSTGRLDVSVALFPYTQFEKDFSAIINKALAPGHPDAVAVFGSPFEAGRLVNALRERGYRGRILGSEDLGDLFFAELVGDRGEGTIVVTQYAPGWDAPGARVITAAFKNLVPLPKHANIATTLEPIVANAYDAVSLIAYSVLASKRTDGDSIRKVLLSTKGFPGLSGPITFLPSGDVEKAVMFLEWKGDKGELRLVKRKSP